MWPSSSANPSAPFASPAFASAGLASGALKSHLHAATRAARRDALEGRAENTSDELLVGDAFEVAKHAQIGKRGPQSGQRVDFEQLELAASVATQIHSTTIPAA